METIDETEESTTSSEALNQLIQQLQQELIGEDKRHFDTLAYFNSRIQDEKEKHSKKKHFLETRLLQAITVDPPDQAQSDNEPTAVQSVDRNDSKR